jgi:hypothetical protein
MPWELRNGPFEIRAARPAHRSHQRNQINPVTPEDFLYAIIEMSDDAIFTVDTGGRVPRWSMKA